MTNRLHIPANLERELFIECGYRCVICKETSALQIDHIEEYATVKEHTFENMIVLCANCHSRKQNTSDPRHINKMSLKAYKKRIFMLNSRYSDLEKRFLENCFKTRQPDIAISHEFKLLFSYLEHDGLITIQTLESGVSISGFKQDKIHIILTDKGKDFVINNFSPIS